MYFQLLWHASHPVAMVTPFYQSKLGTMGSLLLLRTGYHLPCPALGKSTPPPILSESYHALKFYTLYGLMCGILTSHFDLVRDYLNHHTVVILYMYNFIMVTKNSTVIVSHTLHVLCQNVQVHTLCTISSQKLPQHTT